jgi:uncharacterized membrane protein
MSSNPYAAPKAAVADAVTGLQGTFIPGGRAVPAGRGWIWIVEGWNLFKRQPGIWIGIVLVLLLVSFAIAFIPLLGSLMLSLAWPVFTAGLVYGARELDEGRELELGHLFVGFRERFGTLVAVGALYLVASLVVMLISALVMGASIFVFFGGAGDPTIAPTTVLLVVLLALALMMPVVMAIWFAPQLVLFQGYGAVQSMRESFFACLKNIMPFLVYGAAALLLFLLATIPLLLGWLVLSPVLAATLYTSYRDAFYSS